ncbi:hypothetical protein AB0J86_35295 [Micromonospora sp. NPDC049559]|uniref:hypothetical protein n=1 Tax=Micromonospora sp. NPDC049559 TaxID=3155923 RepID=UPI00343680E9
MSQPSFPPGPQQPGAGTPQYGAPQTGGPQYGAPGAEPGSPYGEQYPSAPGGFPSDAAPPKKKSKAGKIILIILAVVLVLCVGGGVAAYFATKDTIDEVVDATKTTMVEPPTLAGRAKSTDPDLQKTADELKAEYKSDVPDATSTVGAFYGTAEKEDLLMIAGASGLVADPTKELTDMVSQAASELGATNMATVEAGPLGGEAKCGDGKAEGLKLGVCVWSDRGSVGLVVFYFKTGKEAEAEFLTVRAAVEQRS